MKLPTEKTPVRDDVQDLTVLIYGPPKIGKSTFCSGADGALFLATEPGLNHLNVFQIPIASWKDLLNAGALIAKGGHEFKTIVIDTVDNAYRMCQEHVCEANGVKHPADMPYGKGFALVNAEFHRVLTRLAGLPTGLYLVSHAQDKELETRTGKYLKTMPTLPEGARKIVVGLVDVILFADAESTKDDDGNVTMSRILRTKPDKHYEAGDRTGRLPETLSLDYQSFVSTFKKEE